MITAVLLCPSCASEVWWCMALVPAFGRCSAPFPGPALELGLRGDGGRLWVDGEAVALQALEHEVVALQPAALGGREVRCSASL